MNVLRMFVTPGGLELPLIEQKGKEYLMAQDRVRWFRDERPDWSIETESVSISATGAVFKCTVKNEKGVIMSQAHKAQTAAEFKFGYIEKAETGSISRALGFAGFGTAFCGDELDEGIKEDTGEPNLADAPRARITPINKPPVGESISAAKKRDPRL